MAIRDAIERQLTLEVPRERVWAALTEPDQVRRWFGTETKVDLRPGGKGEFSWDETVVPFTVEEVEPPRRYAYRWEPGATQTGKPTTLVEFTLEEVPEGTLLTLIESGFAELPEKSYEDNSGGWDEELGHLGDYLLGKAVA
jgi:uncharacterized protein YndB with AHSA1/START domain